MIPYQQNSVMVDQLNLLLSPTSNLLVILAESILLQAFDQVSCLDINSSHQTDFLFWLSHEKDKKKKLISLQWNITSHWMINKCFAYHLPLSQYYHLNLFFLMYKDNVTNLGNNKTCHEAYLTFYIFIWSKVWSYKKQLPLQKKLVTLTAKLYNDESLLRWLDMEE